MTGNDDSGGEEEEEVGTLKVDAGLDGLPPPPPSVEAAAAVGDGGAGDSVTAIFGEPSDEALA